MENFISREVLSGSFESFSSAPAAAGWRIGVGAAQSFSKIKLPRSPKTLGATAKGRSGLVNVAKLAKLLVSRPRVLVHAGVALAIVGVVAGSTVNSTASSLKLRTSGYGSAMDQVSTATVAAAVAQKTDFILAKDVIKQADNLNSLVTLPTASDTVLAKPELVQTAGSTRRTVIDYTVLPGDTISGIAAHFGITTNTIKWANSLGDLDTVKPGKNLVILPISGLIYRVQRGDTAQSIADKFQSNAAQIISFNNLEVKRLKAGQRIVVPDGVQEDTSPAPTLNSFVASAAPALTSYSGVGNGYDFGYCTWYVASRRPVPSNWGNAANWYYNAQFSGFKVGSAPRAGAIAWTGAGYAGHVAYVESVHGGMVTISEMNYAGWDVVSYRTVPASSFQYIY